MSLLIPRALVVLDGIAVAVALVFVLAELIDERPLNGLGFLLIPAIPLLVLGQIWIIVTLNARRTPRPSGLLGERVSRPFHRSRSSVASTFRGLSSWGSRVITGGFLLGWLFAMTATPWITNGNPTSGTAGCPWRLDSHGVLTCVSRHTYLLAGASVQRFACGIFMGFFVAHCGVALSEVKLRRGLANPP
jgi:hypothetical protein